MKLKRKLEENGATAFSEGPWTANTSILKQIYKLLNDSFGISAKTHLPFYKHLVFKYGFSTQVEPRLWRYSWKKLHFDIQEEASENIGLHIFGVLETIYTCKPSP